MNNVLQMMATGKMRTCRRVDLWTFWTRKWQNL